MSVRGAALLSMALVAGCKKDPAPASTVDVPIRLRGAYVRSSTSGPGMAGFTLLGCGTGEGICKLRGRGQKPELKLISAVTEGKVYRVNEARLTQRAEAFIDVYYDRTIARCDGTVTFEDGKATIAFTASSECAAWNGDYESEEVVTRLARAAIPAKPKSARHVPGPTSCQTYRRCVCSLRDIEGFGKSCAKLEGMGANVEDDPPTCALGLDLVVDMMETLGRKVPPECK